MGCGRSGPGRAARWLSIGLALSASGCISLAPDYARPAAPVPGSFPQDGVDDGAKAGARLKADNGQRAARVPFDVFIRHPDLLALLRRALRDNRSLRMAVASVVSARSLFDRDRAGLWPAVQADLGATLGRGVTPAFGGSAFSQERYQVGLSLPAYELDLFGRVRNLSDAARERYLGQVQATRAVRLSLIGDVATTWVGLSAARSRLRLAERTMTLAQRATELNQRRLSGGIGTRVDVRQAETIYQRARADVALYTAQIAQGRNALELLLGGRLRGDELPPPLPEPVEMTQAAADPWFAAMPVGLSSHVLLRRPDVMEAEAYLRAAHADIGAARAAHFPTISLTAALGLASTSLAALVEGGTPVWSVNPAISAPIFAGGGIEANVEYRQAERARLLAGYELAIQTAFKEVADALSERATIREQLEALHAQVVAAQEVYALSDARYRQGVDAYLETLDAQRSLYAAELSLIATQQAELNNLIAVYRTLGGEFELIANHEQTGSPSPVRGAYSP